MSQHAILLDYLRRNGRTSCEDLERFCSVRSVTARMTELIRKGHPIEKDRRFEPDARGKVRSVTYYALRGVSAQRDLFQTS